MTNTSDLVRAFIARMVAKYPELEEKLAAVEREFWLKRRNQKNEST